MSIRNFWLTFLFVLYARSVLSVEPVINPENAAQLLAARDHAAVLVRIDGGIPIGLYTFLRGSYNKNSFNLDVAINDWNRIFGEEGTSRYLVISNIKGDLPPLIRAYQNELTAGIPAEKEILLFFDEADQSGIFLLDQVFAFEVNAELKSKINSSLDDVISFIVDEILEEESE
ncbi:MAG: hypothetical protein R3F50_02665 [Gammaproteobacteria bacterium]